MLRRQYKIIALVGIVLLLWFVIYNENNFTIVRKIKWQFYSSLEGELYDFAELETYTLPNLEDEKGNDKYVKGAWYLHNGQTRPTPGMEGLSAAQLLPDPKRPYEDRIQQQLMYIPPDYGPDTPHKLVLMYNYLGDWLPHKEGTKAFKGCPVDRCFLTTKNSKLKEADAVLFDNTFLMPSTPKQPGQIWIIYMLESPLHTREFHRADVFNWTMTYRPDSDLSTPYGKWVLHETQHRTTTPLRNFAANKTKQVAWFASNCVAKNLRLEYARELSRYIQVDIFGECGDKQCNRNNEELCFKLLTKKYKFYLAFENSNCNYYITEKFFRNALRHNVVPVVMGARKGDYVNAAPAGSFIHVDDFSSPEALAEYLHKLDNDDDLYNQYFLWRGTGEFIDEKMFCRICTMLHSKTPDKYYKDINHWWSDNHVCSTNY